MAKKLITVEYKVNNKELIQTRQTLDGIESEAKQADDQIKKFGKDAKKAGDDSSKSFLNFQNVWKGILALGIAKVLTDIARKTFDLGVKQEQLNIAFETFTGSAERAKKLIQELTRFSIITPFTPEQVNAAAKSLLAFGVEAEEIVPTLKFLGDVSAGTGKDLSEMAVIFGQIRSTGRLMGQDLLQLINAGFNPLQIISEKTGKSVGVLKKEMENGLITFDMVKQAFVDATSEGGRFFNLMEKQSVSVGGVLSTISGNFDEALKNIFAANTGIVKEFVDQLQIASEAFLNLTKSADQIADEKKTQQLADYTELFKAFAASFKDVNRAAEVSIETIDKEIESLQKRNDAIYAGAQAKDGEYTSNLKLIEQRKLEKQAIEDYIKGITDAAAKKAHQDKLARLEREAALYAKIKGYLKDIEDPEIDFEKMQQQIAEGVGGGEVTSFIDSIREQLDADTKATLDKLKETNDAEFAAKQEQRLRDLEAEEIHQANIKRVKQEAFDYGLDLIYQAVSAQILARDNDLQNLTGYYNEQIALAGNNEQKKQELAIRRDRAIDEQSKVEARKEQDRKIKLMILETLLNSIKALGTPPVPNYPLAKITALYGAGSVIAAKAIGFKEGGWIHGPGSETSDSIPIMASKNEYMVNAKSASGAPNLLEAINSGKIDDSILKRMKVTKNGVSTTFDDSRIVKELQKGNSRSLTRDGLTLMETVEVRNNFKRRIRAKFIN